MYEFRETNEIKRDEYLSSQAMIWDDKLLEDYLKGYNTLTVTGREAIGYSLDSIDDIHGRDGGLTLERKLLPRHLNVRYKLQADSNKTLQEKFRALHGLLLGKDVPIQFRDDLDITYYGQLVQMEQVPVDRNNVISSFQIRCDDPFKYGKNLTAEGNPIVLYINTTESIQPDEIELVVEKNTEKIQVVNESTGRRIILAGDYKKDDVIKIDVKNNRLRKNGQNIMTDLVYEATDWKEFKLHDKDRISVIPNDTKMKISYRERWR